jgi:hypothetical protein
MPNERDIALGGLIQLALMDDEEALLSRTLWSDSVLQASRDACKRGINLHAVMVVLREEAKKRNLCDDFEQDALPGTARRIVPEA